MRASRPLIGSQWSRTLRCCSPWCSIAGNPSLFTSHRLILSRVPRHTTILEVSSSVFATLRDIARVSPIPYIQEAATPALGIITIVQVSIFIYCKYLNFECYWPQDMNDCLEGLRRLTRDACGLVNAMIEAVSMVELPSVDVHSIAGLLW